MTQFAYIVGVFYCYLLLRHDGNIICIETIMNQSTVNSFKCINLGNVHFQARKYGYVVEICEPDTPWRFKAPLLAKYDQLCCACFRVAAGSEQVK